MNVGVAVNPVASVVDLHAQVTLGATTAPAVRTVLPAAQAINQAANIPALRNEAPRRADKAAPGPSRVVIIDPQTNAIVYRSLDAYTGGIIEQVPAQALLRQRAYEDSKVVQALIDHKNPTTAELAAVENVDTTT